MKTNTTKSIRCAIYTRKSTEEGLQQAFNTLDAQRESAEAYITAHKHEGWVTLADRYDDGGFSGGNLDRPAFQRLMKDVEAGKIDAIVIYKIDRLSRSLLDFARVMELLERHNVALIAITQSLDTKTSMGRLTLNILLSFAQFEREIISERTRDKIAAARRKGKFAGGKPVLGYDLLSSPAGGKLLVNEDEALQVRGIFNLYAQHEALIPTVKELNQRDWRTKRYQTKAGKMVGGRVWGKTELFKLLTNVLYIGRVRYKEETHAGEHTGIVTPALWQKVQSLLQRNGKSGGSLVRNKHGALLRGILRCSCCQCAMGHTYTAKGSKRYRYYTCQQAQKRGWDVCPSKSVPAGEIETFVIDQVRAIGRDPTVLNQTLKAARAQTQEALRELESEERNLLRRVQRDHTALPKLTNPSALADAQDRLRHDEQRLTEIQQQIALLSRELISEAEVRSALTAFDPVWETLSPKEQARIIRLLVERVDYDGRAGTVSVTFRPGGIKTLAEADKELAA